MLFSIPIIKSYRIGKKVKGFHRYLKNFTEFDTGINLLRFYHNTNVHIA